jgi:hypothetical protein
VNPLGVTPAIAHTIHTLYLKGDAEPNDWSKPQPTQQAGEFSNSVFHDSGLTGRDRPHDYHQIFPGVDKAVA